MKKVRDLIKNFQKKFGILKKGCIFAKDLTTFINNLI
jgi:hypothetical protein